MNRKTNVRRLTQTAMIAALYAAITFAAFYISFGAVQYRISEALTVLPVFTPVAVPGLSIGCMLANLVGFFIGVNPLGWLDAIVGTAATLLAALATRWIGNRTKGIGRYLLAPLPPVLLNAVIVGAELAFVFTPDAFWAGYLSMAVPVLIGQAVVCYGLGVPLMLLLQRRELYKKIFYR